MTKKRSLSGLLFFCYIVQKAQKKLSFLVILPLEKKSEICYNLLVNKEVKPQREELKKMTQQELNKILENHKHWISKDCDEWIKLRADLHGADLRKADLHGADLTGANLRDAEGIPFTPFVCPDTGSFIAYKKAGGYIVKLQIPEDAKRLSATSRKCRCDKAQVLEIQNLGGTTADLTEIRSDHDKNFIYKVGKIVSVDNFDENRWNECSTGIHFFINRQEAVEY